MKIKFITVILIVAAVILTISSCKKDEKEETKKEEVTPFAAEFYFRATIDGQVINFEEGVGGYASGSMSSSSTVPVGSQQILSGFLTIPFMGDEEDEVHKNEGGFGIAKTFASTNVSTEELEAMYSIQSFPYGMHDASGDNGTDGAIIFYVDNDGEYWKSDYGTGDQTGSTFAITEHSEEPAYMGIIYFTSKAEFECTLYNSTGESISLTNGVCKSRTISSY